MAMNKTDVLASRVLNAMGNVQRFEIITVLSDVGELRVKDINKHVKISQPCLSQHLALMKAARIVKSRRDARAVLYSLRNRQVLNIANAARKAASTLLEG